MEIQNETTEARFNRLEDKIDAVYRSVEKTRKYLLIMLIGSILMVVLPLILAGVLLPMALNTLGSMYQI